MTAQQQHAYFNLAIGLAGVVGYFILLRLLGPSRATAAFAILGLCGLGPLLYRKPTGSTGVVTDERDRLINQRAVATAYSVVWVCLFGGFLIAISTLGPAGSVPMQLLATFIWWITVLFIVVHASATLVQYARR